MVLKKILKRIDGEPSYVISLNRKELAIPKLTQKERIGYSYDMMRMVLENSRSRLVSFSSSYIAYVAMYISFFVAMFEVHKYFKLESNMVFLFLVFAIGLLIINILYVRGIKHRANDMEEDIIQISKFYEKIIRESQPRRSRKLPRRRKKTETKN